MDKKQSKARKTSQVPSRVYKYGIYSHQVDIEGRDQVEEQLRLANRYRNRLVEIERERRNRYNAAVLQFPEVAALTERVTALDSEMETLRSEIKQPRQEARARVRVDPEKRQRIEAIKLTLRGLRAELKDAKRRQQDSPDIEAANEWAYEAIRQARKSDEAPYWGTYLRVEDALKNAGKGAPPDFRRYDRTGFLAVQIQYSSTDLTKGLTVEQLLSGRDTRARLVINPDDTTEATLWLRVGTQEGGRQPIWAQFPVKYHRPLPAGALVKWVWVQRTRHEAKGQWGHADDARVWDCCFSLESPSFDVPLKTSGHVAAINLGFRQLDGDRLRVAYLVGSDGLTRQITCEGIQSSLDWADGRRSNRDRGFDVARQQLVIWLRDHEARPEWLTDRTRTLPHWRSKEALDRLVSEWRSNRFDGDQEIYGEVYRWAQEDRHGRQHEAGVRVKAYGRRKQHYRMVATELCRRYSVIKVPKYNLADLKRKAKPEEGESELETVQRRQFNVASQGEFLAALRLAASNQGTTLIDVPVLLPNGRGISQVHYACGHLHGADRAQAVMLQCGHCGVWFDQDQNACDNVLHMPMIADAAE